MNTPDRLPRDSNFGRSYRTGGKYCGERAGTPTKRACLTAAPRAARSVPVPTWDRDEYPRIDSGRRMVRAHKIQGPEWVRAYSRWSLRIEFHLMDEPGTVSLFLNLGNCRERPCVGGRKSNYYKYWVLANGGPPRKHESMDWKVFLGKCFWARVEDCRVDSEGKDKEDHDIYSRIVTLEELITT